MQDVVNNPHVYSEDCDACWWQGALFQSITLIFKVWSVVRCHVLLLVYVTLNYHNWEEDFRNITSFVAFIFEQNIQKPVNNSGSLRSSHTHTYYIGYISRNTICGGYMLFNISGFARQIKPHVFAPQLRVYIDQPIQMIYPGKGHGLNSLLW